MKRIISLILCCLIIAGLTSGVSVFADDTASVYSGSYTVFSGSSVTIYVYASGFSSVASLDLYIYYPDGFSLTGYNVQGMLSGASVSCNTSVAGEIALSAVSLDGISGGGALLSFTLSASSAGVGGYTGSIVPGEAYDTQLQPVSIEGGSFGITVREYVYEKYSDFYTRTSQLSAKMGDAVTFDMYVRDSSGVSSGDFDVSYDPDVLALESVSLSNAFTGADGAICSVNDSVPGYAKISFASLSEVTVYYDKVMTATFTVIADADLTSEVVMSAANLYDGEFNLIKANGVPLTYRVRVEKLPPVVINPRIYIDDLTTLVENFTVSVFAEEETELAAGDFVVSYDSDVLKCVSISGASEGCVVIGNPSYSVGEAKFSFICQGGIVAETEIAQLEFEIVGRIIADTDTEISLSGSGFVDANYNAVIADCISGTVSIDFVREAVGISVETLPDKLVYIKGEEPFDATGGRIKIEYNDDTSEYADITIEMVSGFDNTIVGSQTLTVSYGGFTDTFDVTIIEKSLASIAVTTLPSKTSYLEGKDAFSAAGGKVTLYYNNNTSDVINLTADMVSGFNNNKVGQQTLTVTYNGKTATFRVTIIAKSLTGIAVTMQPTKTSYLEGKDTLDVAGGKITLYYNNDTSEVIDMTAQMVSGFDNSVVGMQTLTVAYGGASDTFEIEILAKSLTGIRVSSLPDKTEYIELKEELAVAGCKIIRYFDNGTYDIVDVSAEMVSGFDNSKLGKQTLTVSYGGFTDTFDVTVIAKSLSSIAVTTLPAKTSYLEGKDAFSAAGGKITLYYNNDTSDEFDLTANMVSGFDNTKVGKQALTVSYGGYTDTFDVEIIAKSLSRIAITTKPSKLTYLEAKETLDVTGGEITLYYNNDTSEVIDMTSEMVSGFDNTIVGAQTLTVTYGGYTDTFDVEIIAKSLVRIAVTHLPNKTEYVEDEELDLSGLEITAYYDNDSFETIDSYEVSGFSSVEGVYDVTVSYGGAKCSFAVRVISRVLLGDVDGDGEVTVADALAALRAAVGLTALEGDALAAADVDGDGDITVSDALRILRIAAGLVPSKDMH